MRFLYYVAVRSNNIQLYFFGFVCLYRKSLTIVLHCCGIIEVFCYFNNDYLSYQLGKCGRKLVNKFCGFSLETEVWHMEITAKGNNSLVSCLLSGGQFGERKLLMLL